jgi:fructose/tagatose bisphosphate aldolase
VKPQVDLPRIKAIHELVQVPLVLHGASGVDDETISGAIRNGICIINIDTELRIAFSDALRESLSRHPDETDPRHFMSPAIDAVKSAAITKLKRFQTRDVLN